MACSDWANYGDALTDGAYWDAILCRLAESSSVGVISLMVLGGLMLAIYIVSGSVIIPLVLMIMLSSLAYAFIPGIGIQIVAITLILGLPAIAYLVVMRLDRGA